MRNIKKRWFLFAAAFVLVAAAGIHMGVKAEEDENRVIAGRVYIGDVSGRNDRGRSNCRSRGLH